MINSIYRRTASSLEFVTPRQSNCPFSPSIVMKFDNGDDVFRSPDTFYYVDDPVVTLIDPLTAIAR